MSEKQPNEPMSFSSFADWCRHIDSLSEEARHTVKVLLKKAGTDDPEAAEQILSSMTELDLRQQSNYRHQLPRLAHQSDNTESGQAIELPTQLPRLAHQSDNTASQQTIKLPTSASSARSPI
jgi:hypothetical protein